jgi:hypothetical protein
MPGEKKVISIVVTGSGNELHEVEIESGVTVRDLLEKLDLVGELSKVDDTVPFKSNAEIYSKVEDGEKLLLNPPSPVAIG